MPPLTSPTLPDLYTHLEAAAPTLPLARTASDIVPGEGPPNAQVMCIGEAPGAEEAKLRRPFVGRSGQFFRKAFAEVGIDPVTIYISNIVKVRPPENRDPTPIEIAAYKPYLDREIELIKPQLIVTLGRFSMGKFLPDVKISQVHGRLHKVNWYGTRLYVLPFYHPAAALRGTAMRDAFVADAQKIPKVLKWIEQQHETEQLKEQVAEVLF